ncbi:MAG: flagellar export chaperone FliS [Planctomycetaceae bacterium]|jgi:flagellar secretion chaperone FliS|nr:flagellar export chaperone FliS [Planctomycetaceae bacterium]MBT6153583.1 flagellar export chaperone FliS [Planctomycetaceae bacterium]MBT6483036.1 flagellar export chaperone FliS [Planctomycetaceae bacterium]MBT6497589.1 flagellar export chaperone FliS [Planctomycetaceae bacterium]
MHGQNEYLESQVMTASPYRLHLMVVEAAIRHAVRAEQALADNDFETTHQALSDSRRFVGELITGLNEEEAPELVGRLKALFLFAFRNLVEADLNQDVAKLDDALNVLKQHRDTWLEVAEQLETVQDTGATAGSPPRPHISQSASNDDAGQSWMS